MGPKLLREFYGVSLDPKLIKEDRANNGGRLMVRGIIQKAETKNQNGRIYPRSVLVREIENYQKAVRENRAVGECDHPDSSTVSLQKVSHVIREMWWDGNNVMGLIEVLSTPCGQILESLIESGITLGISSRGVGSTSKNESGADIVQDDFQLCAFDMVAEPSTPGAYMQLSEARAIGGSPSMERPDRVFRAVNSFLMRKGAL